MTRLCYKNIYSTANNDYFMLCIVLRVRWLKLSLLPKLELALIVISLDEGFSNTRYSRVEYLGV